MRTRLHRWYNAMTTRANYGIQVFHDGKWMHTYEDGKALVFPSKSAAEKTRKELLAEWKKQDQEKLTAAQPQVEQ